MSLHQHCSACKVTVFKQVQKTIWSSSEHIPMTRVAKVPPKNTHEHRKAKGVLSKLAVGDAVCTFSQRS